MAGVCLSFDAECRELVAKLGLAFGYCKQIDSDTDSDRMSENDHLPIEKARPYSILMCFPE